MNKYLQTIARRTFLVGAFLLCAIAGWSQVYQNGIRQGMVKVKFKAEMTSSLSTMHVSARTSGLSTGMEKFDAAAKKSKARNMYRLFPYDARYESKLRKHGLHLWYVVEIDKNIDPKTAVSEFKQLKEITTAEVEHEKVMAPYSVKQYTPTASTFSTLPFNDPLLKDQWHYNNTGQTGFAEADVNLFEAWAHTTGANNIIVSVHDEGVDVNHNDLKANIWVNQAELNGTPNVDDDANGYIDDINGYNFEKNKGAVDAQYHGTHVSGTIAAVNNNGLGVSGVAGGNGTGNGVKIMSLQIMGGAAIEKSYVYAANNGSVISQNSWGYSSPGFFDQSVLDAIDYFVTEAGDYAGSPMKGGIVIFAAGNSNYDGEWYPGYHPNALSVASLGPDWKRASYSNFGAWIEISAPGGEMQLGTKNGVLSTIPNNQYAYLEGTSMACPHVSGIAALALANRTHQLTNTELWNKLVTGAVGIDSYNEDYVGKLGSGAIDASLAIRNDQQIAPATILNLTVTGISQEFATLTWTVPADGDDNQPVSFQLYHHTQSITPNNLNAATKTNLKNALTAGGEFSYELDSLLGLTTYYFAVTSTDRWGNVSLISNVVSETTNQGPSIAVDESSQDITLEIEVASSTSATHNITILNEASGILRWKHFMRHKNTSLSFNAASLNYPVVTKQKTSGFEIGRSNAHVEKTGTQIRSSEPQAFAFQNIEKTYASWPTNIIGETDLSLTNSAGARFHVSEPAGFNLTQVQMYLKHDPAKGPVILEVYKGTPTKNNLVYAQEHSNWSASEANAYITLNEQLYFESGSTFWVVFHVPAGNLFPLGIGYEVEESNSTNCFMSFNMGATWAPLEEVINNNDFAWTVTAASYNAHLGTYLTLDPESGDINGNESSLTTLTANASTLINGNYNANLVLASNDAQQQELRIPVNVTVSGHKPKLKHIDIAEYGSVFLGTGKTLELVLENVGYGNFNDPQFSITNSDFTIVGSAPWQIKAREEVVVKIKLIPATPGNINGILNITNGDQTYQVSLFGVGAETSDISITPESQVVNNVMIGDVVNAQVTVQNNGAYPLKYFIPGYDEKGISENWPSKFHSYGYKFRSNRGAETNPIAYEFQDISTTGTKITDNLKDDGVFYTLDMGFEFPYYGQNMQTLYIAQKGFTTFDNSVRPINSPGFPGNSFSPRGIITPLGTFLSYLTQGNIFYQVEADRVIVQYDNVSDGWNPGSITAQMVLYANGDIRFFYDNMGFDSYAQQSLNIFIEDLGQHDGILVHNWNNPVELYNGLALGFDYPGPNIITDVTNGSGILAPGASSIVNITLSTESLVEGNIKRYVNFISNDPAHTQTSALIELEINNGGAPEPIVSIDTVIFGNVFQGAVKTQTFTIKNPGTASVDITTVGFVSDAFTFTGESPTSIAPGLYKKYQIQVPTNTLATLEDWLSIDYADGTHDTVYITATIVDPPAINVDLSAIQETLAYGETSTRSLSIENTGLAPLEVVTTGKQWLSFEAPSAVVSNTYSFEKHNTGGVYQWIDIRESGTQLPFLDYDNFNETFWRNLELPFSIDFYGVTYTSMKIGDNGIISFEDAPEGSLFTDYIPSETHSGPCIMPYWTFSGFSDYLFPKEDIGIFYQAYDDKFIILWSYFTNNFGGMGDPVSAEAIFYKNGTMKFQYKREEGGADITSHFGTIGLQKNSTEGVAISEYQPLDHGDGLAYIVVPAKKHMIAPGTTLVGDIKIDAMNIYGGTYNEALKIQTNVPGSENLEKPVELTVTGNAVVDVVSPVDFGSKMVAFEFGSPVQNYVAMNIGNTGSASYDITWAQMADASQGLSLQIWALVDGWFGPEWRWADISELYSPWAWETPVFTVNPGDVVKARAVFAPSISGNFTDELVLTTSVGDIHSTLTGTGFEPPVMEVDTTPIEVSMNGPTETETRSISFNNVNGQSNLVYEASIDFGRATPSRASKETIATSAPKRTTLSASNAKVSSVASTTTTYNRTLKHTPKDTPDTFIGTGGSAPFTLATKYNAGPTGFNLSHVETWFRTEDLAQGTVSVEVRAGGNTIADAVLLAEGSINFTNTIDEAGAWHQATMNHPASIYPNEDFYVVVTYPLGIKFPQGTVMDEATIANRYYYFSEGLWYDIQLESGFASAGWLMFAGEETAGNSSWLTITSNLSGTVAMGETSAVEISLEGAFSKEGDQVATIVIKSNDPNNAVARIPVTLHLNEAPKFTGLPESILINENESYTLNLGVTDAEENDFTVASDQTYADVTSSFANGTLAIVMTPDFGDEGTYTYTFIAKDEHNAEREITLTVEVAHTNQAPLFTGDAAMSFNATGKMNEYSIEDYFSDPDGDSFTFTLTSSNSESVVVFASETGFLIRPMELGTSDLILTATDVHGAVTSDTIEVTVDVVLSGEGDLTNNGLGIYPNPAKEKATVTFSNDWAGEVTIMVLDAVGKKFITKQANTGKSREVGVDVSALPKGLYVLRAESNNKRATIKLIKD